MSDHPLHRSYGVWGNAYGLVCLIVVMLLVCASGSAWATSLRASGALTPAASNEAVESAAAEVELPDTSQAETPPPHVLAGRVIYPGPDGGLLPVPDARVGLFRCLHDQHDPVLVDFVGTGEEGGFRFRDVPEGHYLLSVTAPEFLPQMKHTRVHPEAPSSYEFVLRPIPPAEFGAVAGQVFGVDPSGEEIPLPGAQVTLFVGELPVRETGTHADGDYELGRLLPGEYRLRAQARGHEPAESTIAIQVDEVTECSFRLTPAPPPEPGALAGQVLGMGPDGELVVPHAVVVLFDGPRPVGAAVADEEGSYAFDELRPGRYHLAVLARGYLPAGAVVDVFPGELTEQDFLLDPLGPPPQACCFDDGTCEMLPARVCVEAGGEPQGEGVMCAPDLCGE